MKYFDMKKYLFKEDEHLGGIHKVYKFPNEFGASVIKNPFSYGGYKGLYELAMVQFIDEDDYELFYDSDIVNGDVLGYLTKSEVREVLKKIKNFSY